MISGLFSHKSRITLSLFMTSSKSLISMLPHSVQVGAETPFISSHIITCFLSLLNQILLKIREIFKFYSSLYSDFDVSVIYFREYECSSPMSLSNCSFNDPTSYFDPKITKPLPCHSFQRTMRVCVSQWNLLFLSTILNFSQKNSQFFASHFSMQNDDRISLRRSLCEKAQQYQDPQSVVLRSSLASTIIRSFLRSLPKCQFYKKSRYSCSISTSSSNQTHGRGRTSNLVMKLKAVWRWMGEICSQLQLLMFLHEGWVSSNALPKIRMPTKLRKNRFQDLRNELENVQVKSRESSQRRGMMQVCRFIVLITGVTLNIITSGHRMEAFESREGGKGRKRCKIQQQMESITAVSKKK